MGTRYVIDGYGQLEINNCAFRRDGRIEAQCALDSTAFSQVPCENGMLLAVDNIKRTVAPVTSSEVNPVALVYTTEHMYDERTPGLKNFKTEAKDDFYPRLGYLSVGDKFTTNCVSYDSSEFATESALVSALEGVKTTKIYGGTSSDGSILLSASAPTTGPKLLVRKKTTMPDGTFGVAFVCIAD